MGKDKMRRDEDREVGRERGYLLEDSERKEEWGKGENEASNKRGEREIKER